jgi:mevalonate kinase
LKVCGKCILLGEHSVVRGAPALVFPLQSRFLEIKISTEENSFSAPLQRTIKRALEILQWSGKLPPLQVESNIPMQAGLGSSAALSVAVVKFLQTSGAPIPDPFALALELENLFHGKSSGIDLAAVMAETPIRFQKDQPVKKLNLDWKPHLHLVDTGLRSSTKTCVEKVASLQRPDLDSAMTELVNAGELALQGKDLAALAEQMNAAHEIFREWNLVPYAVEKQRSELLNAGALAAKLTGSGDGGFLLTLWQEPQKYISVWNL